MGIAMMGEQVFKIIDGLHPGFCQLIITPFMYTGNQNIFVMRPIEQLNHPLRRCLLVNPP